MSVVLSTSLLVLKCVGLKVSDTVSGFSFLFNLIHFPLNI